MGKYLFLSGNLFPCASGDSIYSAGVAERLAKAGHTVDILTFGTTKKVIADEDYRRLRPLFSNMEIVPTAFSKIENITTYILTGHNLHTSTTINSMKKIKDTLNRSLVNGKYDYIIIDHLRMYSVFKSSAHLLDRAKTKVILLEHNVEYKNMQEKLSYEKSFLEKLKIYLFNYNLKNLEYEAVNYADYLWGICEEDIREIRRFTSYDKIAKVVPPYFNYARIKSDEEIAEPTYILSLLGTMSWYPNIEGVKYFIENIFSKLQEYDNRYRLYIIGRNPSSDVKSYQSNKIIVTGELASVDDYLRKSDFVVVPNKLGSGVKIKILESILKGIPVISCRESITGYPEEIFAGGFCVNDDDEFVNNIIALNNTPERKIDFINRAQRILRAMPDLT